MLSECIDFEPDKTPNSQNNECLIKININAFDF